MGDDGMSPAPAMRRASPGAPGKGLGPSSIVADGRLRNNADADVEARCSMCRRLRWAMMSAGGLDVRWGQRAWDRRRSARLGMLFGQGRF